MTGATILVVEDEPAVASLITSTLTLAGFKVVVAQNAAQAQDCFLGQTFDLALIDWMMPKTTGIALANSLRASPATRTLPLILLTAKATENDKITGLEAGVDDYITKPFSPRELVARVQALLRRAQPLRVVQALVVGVLTLNPEDQTAVVGGTQPTLVKLSNTEFKLLHCLMLRKGRVNTREALLEQAWGEANRADARTVDTHIKSLRRQLTSAGCPPYIHTHRGMGYSFQSL